VSTLISGARTPRSAKDFSVVIYSVPFRHRCADS
jgi:hypothetical protein